MSELMDGHRVGQGNLGRSSTDPILASGSAGKGALGQPVSLIQFSGSDKDPRVMTASVSALTNPGATGPYTGIVRWASGLGDQQQLEFDIVCITNLLAQGLVSGQGGTQISVVGSSMEVLVRNDAGFRPNGDPANDPLGDPTLGGIPFTASIGVGNKPSGLTPQRTVVAVNKVGGLAAAAFTIAIIPPFARSFRVFRSSAAESISFAQMSLYGGGNQIDGPYNVGANVVAPSVELLGNASVIKITNTGGAALDVVGVVFQLGGV